MSQEAFNAADTAIKIIGLMALVSSGFFAWQQYTEGQEREYKKVFYDKQMSIVMEVFAVFTEFDLAESPKAKERALNKFWMIYKGSGRVFLSPKMFESLSKLPLDYALACVKKDKKYKPKILTDCNNFDASMSMAGFALVAREELAKTWLQEFKSIGAEDPWLGSAQ